jgi:3-hydroxyacyl-CoA dehydrogenase
MTLKIKRAAVLGAGVMGAQIAALLAAAGVKTHLLDLATDAAGEADPAKARAARSRRALDAVENLKRLKPAPLFKPEHLTNILPGNFDDDMPALAGCDWILEAVVERLDIKQALHRKIAQHARAGVPVTTNTSGLSLAEIVEGLPESYQQRFFGTHFFNPPRYMRLLEVIPHAATDTRLFAAFETWAEERLGKGLVRASDSVNFIANRLGTFCSHSVMRAMQELDLNVETIDFLTGPLLGRAKSGTFRTADVVGLDTSVSVALNNYEKAPNDPYRDWFLTPSWFADLVERGALGQKTNGTGIYKKSKDAQGNTVILSYRPIPKSYEAPALASFPWMEAAAKERDLVKRVKLILQESDAGAQLVWRNLRDLFSYASYLLDDIAGGLVQPVDDAIRWGFGWAMGPFELWQALGYDDILKRMRADSALLASWLEPGLSFYAPAPGSREWQLAAGPEAQLKASRTGTSRMVKIPRREHSYALPPFEAKEDPRLVLSNPSASLLDIGDGVACLVFHSKMNTLNSEISALLDASLDKVDSDFAGLVIANDAVNFSAGADIRDFLAAIQGKNWSFIDTGERRFQALVQKLKFAPFPVVSCPTGLTLGGGCEFTLHTSVRLLAAETYAGLVEAGVGLLPAGGGTKELTLRAYELAEQGDGADAMPFLKRAFELITTARRSSSGYEAIDMGLYPAATSHVSLSREHLVSRAKRLALTMVANGFTPKTPRLQLKVVGMPGIQMFRQALDAMVASEKLTAYDAVIGEKIATILCGGAVEPGTVIGEDTLLDLERELFVELCQQPKTYERIAHMLKSGKPLRN